MDARVTGVVSSRPVVSPQSAGASAYRMLLIGAGELAESVAVMAQLNGFAVTVCDPRIDCISAWSVPGVERLTLLPDDAVVAFAPDMHSCVVMLDQDPALTDLALLEALRSDAFYIGAVGSWLDDQRRRDRLIEQFGESGTSLQRLRGPIGIALGSQTCAEMAVGVMAEILAAKNGVLPVMMADGSGASVCDVR